MLGTIVGLVIIGLIAGFIARAVVPGKQHMGVGATILLGIVGSFIGGFLGKLLFGADAGNGFVQPSSWIGSIIGAIIALLIWISVSKRSAVRR
ncbi:GlsB/YeaQ/YmgE family stress response membrane protein [Kineococcus sp. R8]|uniref:GlsB/YeaQ/YmgE family stress response membrane protein n=1 Tax=Kineococcus siccus TaxID=2696567 RepID=UPI001413559C|nr:GlsB/YeaQ/YmgE family stress response membrane protein [Kineococcus siccus]NAZ82809.1 GlsB/YeaQ/YmgE family stress response membrane protein [Kineococcus siccus]